MKISFRVFYWDPQDTRTKGWIYDFMASEGSLLGRYVSSFPSSLYPGQRVEGRVYSETDPLGPHEVDTVYSGFDTIDGVLAVNRVGTATQVEPDHWDVDLVETFDPDSSVVTSVTLRNFPDHYMEVEFAGPQPYLSVMDKNFAELIADGDFIHGSHLNDRVKTTNASEKIDLFHGSDEVYARGGNDSVWGGGGADTLRGGEGNDILKGGDGRDKLVGDNGADYLKGGASPDKLFGGLGNDTLVGGTSADRYYFNSALGPGNVDEIRGFKQSRDMIVLDDKTFTAIGARLTASEFYAKAGAKSAHDSTDHIIYDTRTGKLYYDHDAKGGADAIHFATLTGRPGLSTSNFDIA